MKFAIIGVALSILGGAAGQLFMKSGMTKLDGLAMHQIVAKLHSTPGLFAEIFIGLVFYSCSVFSWLVALRYFDLNLAYPLLALGYAVVYIGAAYWPGIEEPFTLQKTLGVFLIIVGVVLTTLRGRATSQYE